MELGGYKVPKGTLLFLSMGGMHVSPHNFLEAHRFYPVSVGICKNVTLFKCCTAYVTAGTTSWSHTGSTQ
jgi:hypothetical protein